MATSRPAIPGAYFLRGSKVITRNNDSRAEETRSLRAVDAIIMAEESVLLIFEVYQMIELMKLLLRDTEL